MVIGSSKNDNHCVAAAWPESAVHNDMKSHTGGVMLVGCGVINSKPPKQNSTANHQHNLRWLL